MRIFDEPLRLPEDVPMPLPRLLFLADVPVESSYHGSALLYRLLQKYPPEQLCIVEAGIGASRPDRRLTGVRYHFCPPPLRRLQTTRFAEWYAAVCLLAARKRAHAFWRLASEFQPAAVLTVTHGYSWITAAALAQSFNVPLHLICHDEWPTTVRTLKVLKRWKSRVFDKYYRAARTRSCVSPFMAERYRERYGVPGGVLYPSRASDAQRFTGPPERLRRNAETFTCAFAGTINSPGTTNGLTLLAASLRALDGRLLIFGPLDRAQAETSGLIAPNIELCGLLSSKDLVRELRKRADTLFVPMSFSPEDRANMEINFPSKLTEYTAVGLPILVFGPSYSSAVQWAKQNAGIAAIVDVKCSEALTAALNRIKTDPIYRIRLANTALNVGDTYFSYEATFQTFRDCLTPGASVASSKNDMGRGSSDVRR
jgi:glycosyltransferase involved in cell wall biosynthesis